MHTIERAVYSKQVRELDDERAVYSKQVRELDEELGATRTHFSQAQAQLSLRRVEEERQNGLIKWLHEQLAEHAPAIFRRGGLGALVVSGHGVGQPRDSEAHRTSNYLKLPQKPEVICHKPSAYKV